VIPAPLTTTRRALHGVAELLLAGPQHAECKRIQLVALPGGFGTRFTPDLRVEGTSVVADGARAAIDGRTIRDLGSELGITPQLLSHVYHDGSGVDLDEVLHVDEGSAVRLVAAYTIGDEALQAFAPTETPVLWPEHFDIAVTVDQVNYGVSPGDSFLPVPYMYVGPWEPPAVDDFWTQPFGAARELPGSVAETVAFFEEARARLA